MKLHGQFRLDAPRIGVLAVQLILTQLALALFNQLRTMATGLVTGTGNPVAFASGQGDAARIMRIVRASFALSTLAALAFWLTATATMLLRTFEYRLGASAKQAGATRS
ncbi:hypothetical protein [Burkholderia pyrrocinia]|uniref:hypothetical protein n=1 Tax=Burkholderia pyrrocinia TaxID=60550 RepID=UPI0020C66488|nr:hypothetical protein [Burkholderia pyrrocinia]